MVELQDIPAFCHRRRRVCVIIIDRITLPGSGFGTETIRHFGHENGNCVCRRETVYQPGCWMDR